MKRSLSTKTLITLVVGVFSVQSFAIAKDWLSDEQFILGKSFFEKPWVAYPASTTARDGLGPLFNQNACVNCHPKGGRSDKFVIKLDNPNTIYGTQINTQSSQNVTKEATVSIQQKTRLVRYADGEQVVLQYPIIQLQNLGYGEVNSTLSMRISPSLQGVGLLSKIPGKPENRFNLTASEASIFSQVANAAHNDMGLTNALHPQENCTQWQSDCNNAPKTETLDLPQHRLEAITYFVKNLNKVSYTKPILLFYKAGCADCHTPSYALENQTIYPYTDLLTHNLGEGKFRTAPLWNSSKAPNFWHDGRAKTVEQAVLWHNGAALKSKRLFMSLPKSDRGKILAFINTL
ncbi:Probable thiol oxidoreductase with 2 cytochrome c heme-binding sites [uncultured Candidatus Thioglobus sp.]|nr:Probable thiol oxidoreductase with 2 cytochrome c heme-binding sites [uncultured Candidatus Thioglobus sp.]